MPPGSDVASIAAATAALQRGEVIVFPTETLYGLGANALNEEALEHVFRLKGRNPSIPIPLLIADETMLGYLADVIPPAARELMRHFWPGPLTLVLPARVGIPRPLLNASGGIAVRISSHPTAMHLVRALGRPLTATSANPSGSEPARTLSEAKNYFSGRVNIFVDGGTLTSKTGSTIAELRGDKIRLIREGDIGAAALEAVLGRERVLR